MVHVPRAALECGLPFKLAGYTHGVLEEVRQTSTSSTGGRL
jgi:hypothetical protein